MGDSPTVRDERAVTKSVDEPIVGGEALLRRREEIEAAAITVPVDGAEAGEPIQDCELTRFRIDGSLRFGHAARCVASETDHRVGAGNIILGGMQSELSHLVAHRARTFLTSQDERIAARILQLP